MPQEFAQMLQANPTLFFTLVGFIGLCIGSFINVVIYRIPIMLEQAWSEQIAQSKDQAMNTSETKINLFFPRSHCPHCKTTISISKNIPFFSYVFLGGKSACCQKNISMRYPLTELLCLALSFLVAFRFGFSWECLAALGFTWALVALVLIDIEHQLLPDTITLPLIWAGLLINTTHLFASPEAALLGAAGGYFIFWFVAFVFKHWRKIDGLGQGDFKLLAACGAWLGLSWIPFIVLLSSALGTVIGALYLLLSRQNLKTRIPFGPFIAIAAFTALMRGDYFPTLLR